MLSILCVILTIKVKVGIPESFKVGWYSPQKLGRVTLRPIDLEHSLSQSPNFGTNYLTTYAPIKHKLKTYLFENYYSSH